MATKTTLPKTPAKPPATKKKPPPMPPPTPTAPAPTSSRAVKKFTVEDWDGDTEGHGIVLHGKYGMGKTNLAALAPAPVFIGGLDAGGSKIKHPVTGEKLKVIPGIETFQDVRDVLHQVDLFDPYETIVLDTGTQLQHLGLLHTFATVKGPKNITCTNIEQYGYHKGYRHLYDTMHHILGDLDPLIKRGKNVIIVCQSIQTKVSNPGGEDFLRDTPDLQTDPKANVAADYMSWADHIFMIDHTNIQTEDKKAVATGGRCIRVHPEIHFEAKSRTLGPELATVTFDSVQDDSIWQFLFGGGE